VLIHEQNYTAIGLRSHVNDDSVTHMRNIETPTAPAKCLRCGHRIRSAASLAAKYGPVCRAKIRLAAINEAICGFAQAQIDKARELIADGGLVPTGRKGVFRAVSSKGDGTAYLVHAAVCACPAGVRGRACYHLAAARILTATGKAA
jgi:hypothetical protein